VTFEEAVVYVRSRLPISTAETDVVDQIERQLDQEYQRLVSRYRLLVTTATLVVTIGDPIVDLPDDLVEILKINRDARTIKPVTWTQYAELQSEPDSASEQYVYIRDGIGRIRVSPLPSVNEEGVWTLWYAQAAPAWDGTPANELPAALPAAYHDLIPERVVEWIALLEEEQQLASVARANADALEADLRKHLSERTGEGPRAIAVRGLG
jgi:hypothetical protein